MGEKTQLPKSVQVFAVVNKNNYKISPLDIYPDRQIVLDNFEELWVVKVTPIKKIK